MKYGMPTKHRGRLYRSRLEARWASFFDKVGWPYEYEPYALKGWVPDFLLLTAIPVLVEVKPVAVFPLHIANEIKASEAVEECLIVGASIPVRSYTRDEVHPLCFGWLAERTPGYWWWDDAMLGCWDNSPSVGFCHRHGSRVNRVTGQLGTIIAPTAHKNAWIDAGNKTQWMPPRGDGR